MGTQVYVTTELTANFLLPNLIFTRARQRHELIELNRCTELTAYSLLPTWSRPMHGNGMNAQNWVNQDSLAERTRICLHPYARSHTHSYIHTHERQLLFWHIHTCIMLVCPFHRYQRNLYMTRDSHRHTDRNYVYYCYYCYYFYFYYDYRNLARIKRDLYQRTLEMTRDSHRHWDRFSLSLCLYVYWSVCLLLAAFVSCHI